MSVAVLVFLAAAFFAGLFLFLRRRRGDEGAPSSTGGDQTRERRVGIVLMGVAAVGVVVLVSFLLWLAHIVGLEELAYEFFRDMLYLLLFVPAFVLAGLGGLGACRDLLSWFSGRRPARGGIVMAHHLSCLGMLGVYGGYLVGSFFLDFTLGYGLGDALYLGVFSLFTLLSSIAVYWDSQRPDLEETKGKVMTVLNTAMAGYMIWMMLMAATRPPP
ncbi:MAG: hypothetical protein VX938_03780 [Myxococcota bacterium]|nr:hypothetical protein [Myxococcota bacterium]